MLPSIKAVTIATADPALFEHLLRQAGFTLVQRDHDPLRTTVQEETVTSVASLISESVEPVKLGRYHKTLKEMAEKMGYIAIYENEFPPEEAEATSEFPSELPGEEMPEDEVEGEFGPETDMIPPDDMPSPEEEAIAQIPLGAELASAVMDVIRGNTADGVGGGMVDSIAPPPEQEEFEEPIAVDTEEPAPEEQLQY